MNLPPYVFGVYHVANIRSVLSITVLEKKKLYKTGLKSDLILYDFRIKHVPFDFVVCEQSFPRIKPELSEDDIITSMKSRDDQIRPSDEQCAELKELHDSVVQGIQKAQQSGGDSDFITESDPAENAQILDFHTIGSYTRNCLLKDSLKVSFMISSVKL